MLSSLPDLLTSIDVDETTAGLPGSLGLEMLLRDLGIVKIQHRIGVVAHRCLAGNLPAGDDGGGCKPPRVWDQARRRGRR